MEGVPGPRGRGALAVGEGYGAGAGGPGQPPPLARPGRGAALGALLHHGVQLDVGGVRAFGWKQPPRVS